MTVLPPSTEYAVPAGHFDELRTADGGLRQPWAEFAAATELRRGIPDRGADARRPSDPRERRHLQRLRGRRRSQRPWTLDVLPLIVPAQEWERLGRGLRQRARLLNALAADLYGAQALLRTG